jgi:hypothetical protein
MTRSTRIEWLPPTLTSCAVWLLVTGLFIAFNGATGSALPSFVAKAGPFLIAGFATGRLAPVSRRRPKIIAAAILTVVSAVAWTSFSFATQELSASKALLLLALALPINALGGAWAYFGMFLGGRRSSTPTSEKDVGAELDGLDSELEKEIARERATDSKT